MNNVKTKNGTIAGAREGDVLSYKGVPYAKPPVGDLRFMPAQKPEGWEGVLDASSFGAACPQTKKYKVSSEDCLTLNIWTPGTDKKKRAVFFYIHGGSFCMGAGSDPEYNGANLAKNGDVVVVTINYRLGALGFLDFSFLGEEFSPNCGLSDIVMALRWVYENIAAFGGDPQSITVLGQSAGAIAASVLPVTPSARKYVSKVIMMSGGPSLLYTKDEYQKVSRKFLKFMGIETAQQLKEMDAQELVCKQRKFASHCGLGDGAFMIEVDGTLVPEYPIPAAAQGAARDIPILIGTTKEEMSFLCIKVLAKVLDISKILRRNIDQEKEEVKTRLDAAYRRYGKRAQSMMFADRVFRMASVWYAEVYNQYANTWMYRFDYETPAMKAISLRACHSCDIPFVFGNFHAGLYKWMFLLPSVKATRRISAEMQNDFVAFAKGETLGWQECRGIDTPAKCYDKHFSVIPMVDPEIEKEYDKSEFKRQSLRGLNAVHIGS
ncbi:MAG: carboxylesterase/lipase family protein [Christensenella sp.]|uniref:carboxylesterase/lipase family protein n=1 Tax=Christensenella sp. TaxID=1935934 RepID=UPI002B213831|nr:carboxylesterase/lipase family protein [Christensenella sp.]MEA5004117.1 carboxylesterase/lipase family protein [Christensenella sp.]